MLNFLKSKFFLKKFNIYLTTEFFKLVDYLMFPSATSKYSNGFKSLPIFGNVRFFFFSFELILRFTNWYLTLRLLSISLATTVIEHIVM